MARTFSIETRTTAPIQELFDVSLSIDAHLASMAHSGERAIGGVTHGSIGLGETVTWRARHFGIWFTMTSQISSLERPTQFVDEQLRGPFRQFHHEHRFREDGGGTLMTDTLTVASPIFARLTERLVLVPYLRRLIRDRNLSLLAALGVEPGTDPSAQTWPRNPGDPRQRYERTVRIGSGDAYWDRVSRAVLRWEVKTRSGFRVDDQRPVTVGRPLTITARVAGITVREPVRVAEVVDAPDRVGFSYSTLPGHPVSGEEAFIVHRAGDEVFLTLRSLTAPAALQPWRALYPVLRIAQRVARRRYFLALAE
ncbi:DUF1990 family protein [Leucobacter luti]|nr:DUF1990 family protein [Leucobacter luti]